LQETLYDRPEQDPKRVRVAGPFTVEAIPVAHLDDEEAQRPESSPGMPTTSAEALTGDWVGYMIDLLKRSGVHFGPGRAIELSSLRPVKGAYEWLHAEAEAQDGQTRRVAVSLGPKHAPVTPRQVFDAISETRGYDTVLFVGFACDPEARKIIDKGVSGRELHFVHAAPDILVTDDADGRGLLKTSKTTRLFAVFGAPDVRVHKEKDACVSVELRGIDLYDPLTGETAHGPGDDAAAFFVDHDYDGRTFCVSQALFPRNKKNPWQKLQKALKGTIDEETFAQLQTTRSLPFKPGKRIAVTVVDDRGNEVVKVIEHGR
jgi:adenine-specific DNA-methyltransferase